MIFYEIYTRKHIIMSETKLSKFVKAERKKYHLTQVELSYRSGVGLRFVRDLEQGKKPLRMDKVNQVLRLFNSELGVVEMPRMIIED